MQVHVETPEFRPITVKLESEKEVEMFKALANYDPYERIEDELERLGVDEAELLEFWFHLESIINRLALGG